MAMPYLQAQQRLNVLSQAINALSGALTSKTAQSRLQKALDRLWTVPRIPPACHVAEQETCIGLTDESAREPAHAASAPLQDAEVLPKAAS